MKLIIKLKFLYKKNFFFLHSYKIKNAIPKVNTGLKHSSKKQIKKYPKNPQIPENEYTNVDKNDHDQSEYVNLQEQKIDFEKKQNIGDKFKNSS